MPQATKKDPRDTPAMRQFTRFKAEHPGCLLLFRMGDFYELFFEDAEIAHRVLGVTLTQRTKGVPMAGVPYHAVEGYLRRLIQAGYRVAVCDQVEDPAQAKGVVKRAVTRVVTPGTLTDDNLLEPGESKPLAAVLFHDDDYASAAWCELSTGAFQAVSLPLSRLTDELARAEPGELICFATADLEAPPRAQALADRLGCTMTPIAPHHFRPREALEALQQQFGVASAEPFGFPEGDPALGAIGAVLRYLTQTQHTYQEDEQAPSTLPHLTPPRRFETEQYLVLDPATLEALEVTRTLRDGDARGSLLATMQGCRTPMGRRLLKQWLCYPLTDRPTIEARQRAVGSFLNDPSLARRCLDKLKLIQDLPRIAARLSVGRAGPRDLVALAQSVTQAPALTELLAGYENLAPLHDRLSQHHALLQELGDRLARACVEEPPSHLRDGGLIRDGYDADLDANRVLSRDAHAWLSAYQGELAESLGLSTLKVGYNKVFGYYIELSKANQHRAPDAWVRKQTLKNAERYITPELKEFEGKALTAASRAVEREQAIFRTLSDAAVGQINPLNDFAHAVAELDVLIRFAELAQSRGYVCPEIVDEPVLHVEAGRHPVLDESLGESFVPNDLALGPHNAASPPLDEGSPSTLALITGPNMAGKSTYIRQAALITLLAHTGSHVPANRAIVGLTDRIATRLGSADRLHAGQSTFMVEMTETAAICHHCTPRSLVVLDEVGRGTSTLDGLSLAWAVAEFLAGTPDQPGPRTLFATHYHELTSLAEERPAVTNLHVTVREWNDRIVFLHTIARGATDQSYGIHVAKLAGLPPSVIARADQVMQSLSVEQRHAPKPGPATRAPEPQMALFKEYLPHPVLDDLRSLDLNGLSPMQAFDRLRVMQQRLDTDDPPQASD